VRFRPGNLLDPTFLAGEAPFDLILCRNLFIYLHPEARRQALTTVTRLLAADGWLCTGHADLFDFQALGFTRIGPASCFLYRRENASDEVVRRREGGIVFAGPDPTEYSVRGPRSSVLGTQYPIAGPDCTKYSVIGTASDSLEKKGEPLPLSPSRQPGGFLTRARQEADRGRLAEALASCQEQLAHFGPSADLYSLMGVVHQARREKEQAVHCYQRALYLEPEHAEALTHLILLSQERGDEAQAERLRRRLNRVAPAEG
jgi:chemotaxis protein methyltransferase WspC